MNVALRPTMSLDAFLAWEAAQEFKHEFDGFRPVAMTGVTFAHARIQSNLAMAMGNRLRGTRCCFLGSDIKVLTGRTVRYPDGLVTCSPGRNAATAASDPVVLFEVLSHSTSSVDPIAKNRDYAGMPSVQRYVMLEQERVGATVFRRDGVDWVGQVLAEGEVLAMPEIGVEVPLAELYEGLVFGEE